MQDSLNFKKSEELNKRLLAKLNKANAIVNKLQSSGKGKTVEVSHIFHKNQSMHCPFKSILIIGKEVC